MGEDIMRVKIAAALLASTLLTLGLANAGRAEARPAATMAQPVRYTARQFFETTSYAMADPDGIAFSPDGRSVLIRSDANGVFNAYALPLAGGDPVPLTQSTGTAYLPLSYFPGDARM